jgi:hypothetical protein
MNTLDIDISNAEDLMIDETVCVRVWKQMCTNMILTIFCWIHSSERPLVAGMPAARFALADWSPVKNNPSFLSGMAPFVPVPPEAVVLPHVCHLHTFEPA